MKASVAAAAFIKRELFFKSLCRLVIVWKHRMWYLWAKHSKWVFYTQLQRQKSKLHILVTCFVVFTFWLGPNLGTGKSVESHWASGAESVVPPGVSSGGKGLALLLLLLPPLPLHHTFSPPTPRGRGQKELGICILHLHCIAIPSTIGANITNTTEHTIATIWLKSKSWE